MNTQRYLAIKTLIERTSLTALHMVRWAQQQIACYFTVRVYQERQISCSSYTKIQFCMICLRACLPYSLKTPHSQSCHNEICFGVPGLCSANRGKKPNKQSLDQIILTLVEAFLCGCKVKSICFYLAFKWIVVRRVDVHFSGLDLCDESSFIFSQVMFI